MPSIFRKDGKKKELIKNLGNIYQNIQREQQISPGDFPELKKMQVNIKMQILPTVYCLRVETRFANTLIVSYLLQRKVYVYILIFLKC